MKFFLVRAQNFYLGARVIKLRNSRPSVIVMTGYLFSLSGQYNTRNLFSIEKKIRDILGFGKAVRFYSKECQYHLVSNRAGHTCVSTSGISFLNNKIRFHIMFASI